MRLRNFLLLVTLLGCSSPPPSSDGTEAGGFSERTVVFLLADSARIEAVRAELSEDDFHAVMDDMMWYRAAAWQWFEDRGIPVVSFDGRPPLSFRVGGEYRDFDFSAHPTLEVVVLYERDRQPMAVAPIDAPTEAAPYFDEVGSTGP